MKVTNAALFRHLSIINRTLAGAIAHLSEGVWDPLFCADDATPYMGSIIEDIEQQMRHLKSLRDQP